MVKYVEYKNNVTLQAAEMKVKFNLSALNWMAMIRKLVLVTNSTAAFGMDIHASPNFGVFPLMRRDILWKTGIRQH